MNVMGYTMFLWLGMIAQVVAPQRTVVPVYGFRPVVAPATATRVVVPRHGFRPTGR